MLQCFNCWQFTLLESTHKVSWSLIFQCNLMNFVIESVIVPEPFMSFPTLEKLPFGFLDDSFEDIPVFNCFGGSISGQFVMTLLIPPCFGTFSNINTS